MNLKKTSSKFEDNSCDEDLLVNYASRHKGMIKNQIELIGADIVICCGGTVFNIMDGHFKMKELRKGAFVYKSEVFGGAIFMRTCHPSSRKWSNNLGQIRKRVRDRYDDLLKEFHKDLVGKRA